jgi:hypothetical protein
MISLGDLVRDYITGFEGIAVAKTEWLYDYRRIGVQARIVNDDGTIPEVQWIDEDQLTQITPLVINLEKEKKNPAGTTSIPKRNIDPTR